MTAKPETRAYTVTYSVTVQAASFEEAAMQALRVDKQAADAGASSTRFVTDKRTRKEHVITANLTDDTVSHRACGCGEA